MNINKMKEILLFHYACNLEPVQERERERKREKELLLPADPFRLQATTANLHLHLHDVEFANQLRDSESPVTASHPL